MANWQDIPKGYYAIPLVECREPFEIVGHVIYERKVARTYKNGRTVGYDRLVGPRLVTSVGVDRQRIDDAIEDQGGWSEPWCVRTNIEEMVDYPTVLQQAYGQFTGRCGRCNKTLTVDESKFRGIGPECVKVAS